MYSKRPLSTKYGVRLEPVKEALTTGPCNMLTIGDSQSSFESNRRVPTGMCYEWKPPEGWSGIYVPHDVAAAGPLVDYTNDNGEQWPFQSLVPSKTYSGGSKTTYNTADFTLNLGTGVPASLPLHCTEWVGPADGNWAWNTFGYLYIASMGLAQTGNVWASDDWITNNSSLRVGIVYEKTSDTETDATDFKLYTKEAQNHTGDTPAASVAHVIQLSTGSNAAGVAWVNIAQSSVSTPFGTVDNEPGPNNNPVAFQYEGYGSIYPGKKMMDEADATYGYANPPNTPPYPLKEAGNANYTGTWRWQLTFEASGVGVGGNNKRFIHYGYILEDTSNTTGLFVWNLAYSGWTTTSFINSMSQTQWTNLFAFSNTVGKPINIVRIQIGVNYTAGEYSAGVYSGSTFRTNILNLISRINTAADNAGIPRPFIFFVTQPRPQDAGTGALRADAAAGAQSTQASILRDLAETDAQIGVVDLYQKYIDRFELDEIYSTSRTAAHMNIQHDALHQSLRGLRFNERFIFNQIMDFPTQTRGIGIGTA
jgi:hypothetical protein